MPLINVTVVCPKGLMFLNAVDCNGELKDATFIANIIIDAIESVGPSNVVQVITDNARVCKAVGLLVEARYENIFWTPCVVHSLNLMLKKIGKIEWIKKKSLMKPRRLRCSSPIIIWPKPCINN
eukprot:Gb_35892 [translate_table: standard]